VAPSNGITDARSPPFLPPGGRTVNCAQTTGQGRITSKVQRARSSFSGRGNESARDHLPAVPSMYLPIRPQGRGAVALSLVCASHASACPRMQQGRGTDRRLPIRRPPTLHLCSEKRPSRFDSSKCHTEGDACPFGPFLSVRNDYRAVSPGATTLAACSGGPTRTPSLWVKLCRRDCRSFLKARSVGVLRPPEARSSSSSAASLDA
jgi:hypothetical protein